MKKLLILLVCMTFIGCLSSFAEDNLTVTSCEGDVKILYPGEMKPIICKPGMPIKAGTKVTTGEESFVEIVFDKGKENLVKVEAESEVVVKLDGSDKVELIDGSLFTLLQNMKKGQVFRVRTPDAACGARGTGWKTTAKDGLTIIAVFDGTVIVRGVKRDGTVSEEEYPVNDGYERKVVRFSPPGEASMMPVAVYQKMRDEFGMDDAAKKAASMFERDDKLNDKREDIMEMKDRDNMQFREEKEDNKERGGGTNGKFKTIGR